MADVPLVVVTAYYLDPTNGPTPLLQENSLMAGDLADSWTAFRAALVSGYGWEPYISPPNDPQDPRSSAGYTKGFFRTPDDQALEVTEEGDGAAAVDQSPHQAGRAFDLDLTGMAGAFSDYDYNTVVSVAAQYGFSPRVAGEAWHFDDNPAANPAYGSVEAAVAAVGNTQAQVTADLNAGLPTPQQAAVSSNANNLLLFAAVALAGLLFLFHSQERNKTKKPAADEAAKQEGPSYVF